MEKLGTKDEVCVKLEKSGEFTSRNDQPGRRNMRSRPDIVEGTERNDVT